MEQIKNKRIVKARNILIVDDDPDICQNLAELFGKNGYATTVVDSGQQAVLCVEDRRPDIVIFDMMMLDMDGWETYRQMRSLSNFPVLFLTALSEGESAVRVRSSDIFDMLRKPFSPKELLARTEALYEVGKTKLLPAHLGEEDGGIGYESTVVVIPAFNEERFIGSTVLKALKYADAVIVVDDGSTDATARTAELAGAFVARHDSNKGKGAALNTGFRIARELRPKVIVMLDADGQHLPEEMKQVIEPVLEDRADIVTGSRYLEKKSRVPTHRIWGHRIFNTLTRLTSGVPASDSQSGYRAFSAKALDIIWFQSDGFSVESEMQFISNQYKLRMVEVPVTIHYPDKPKRNVIAHGLNVLNGVLYLVGRYRPLLFFGVSGFAILLFGVVMGIGVVDIFRRTNELAIGYALISVLLTIFGLVLFSTGIILHSVRGLLMDLLKPRQTR